MKIVLIISASIALSACNPGPTIENVASSAKGQLQTALEHDYADDRASVQKVDVVRISGPKYQGSASIVDNGTTFLLPVDITSDGKTTIIAFDPVKLRAGFTETMTKRLSVIDGKYGDYVTTPDIISLFPKSLQTDKADFKDRLQVVEPVKVVGDFYFGSGCKAHECTMNEAAWVINRNTGAASAIIEQYYPSVADGMPPSIAFHIYGATITDLPPPLAEWAENAGMTEMNSSEYGHTYTPPKG